VETVDAVGGWPEVGRRDAILVLHLAYGTPTISPLTDQRSVIATLLSSRGERVPGRLVDDPGESKGTSPGGRAATDDARSMALQSARRPSLRAIVIATKPPSLIPASGAKPQRRRHATSKELPFTRSRVDVGWGFCSDARDVDRRASFAITIGARS